jgi:hypothetical protein
LKHPQRTPISGWYPVTNHAIPVVKQQGHGWKKPHQHANNDNVNPLLELLKKQVRSRAMR